MPLAVARSVDFFGLNHYGTHWVYDRKSKVRMLSRASVPPPSALTRVSVLHRTPLSHRTIPTDKGKRKKAAR